MIRNLLIFIFLVLVAALVTGGLLWRDFRAFSESPMLHDGASGRLWVRGGDSLGAVAARLEALGLTRADWRWRLLGRMRQPLIQAGEFRLRAGDTPETLLARLESGEVVQHRFTIIEGWTVEELRRALGRDPRLVSVTGALEPAALMERLGCGDCFAEGWFLPETYQFIRGDRDLDLLARAHAAMRDALRAAWRDRSSELPLDSAEELLILASLVEMETMVNHERAEVAGVFARRLREGMRLQTDPTVVYGIEGPFDGRIRRVHLTTDHPWNTYTRHGLPATPIGLPGLASLRAAAHPAPGETLYFVARGDGTHHFSKTLREHNRAVARYILGRE